MITKRRVCAVLFIPVSVPLKLITVSVRLLNHVLQKLDTWIEKQFSKLD